MKKILIVDDEVQILKSLARLFVDTDYAVVIADSGSLGLEKLEEDEFDLVISDMRMPKMDGYTFLSQVKAKYPKVLRIILSGYADEKIVFKALQNNIAKLYLYKPWNNETFLSMIKQLFETEALLLEKNLLEVFNNSGELPSLRVSYMKIINLIENDADFPEITKEIERDISIASKLLHIVNSAFYGLRTGSVKQACVFIGVKNIRSLVLSTSIIDSFGEDKRIEPHITKEWNFAFLTNRILTCIYERILGKKIPDEANSAGLLHNIGTVFMLSQFKEEYLALMMDSLTDGRDLEEIERQKYNVSHQEIGAYLLSWWELPYPIIEGALYHHNPLDERIVNKEIVAAIHLSQYTAREIIGTTKNSTFFPEVYAILGIDEADFKLRIQKFD
mgnify:CR=1 FL=1